MIQAATEEYLLALKKGQKVYRERLMANLPPYPAVLDDILPKDVSTVTKELGMVEIPAERIIGTKSAGRITAFNAEFQPLLEVDSEFGLKWVNLCAAHLGETGITEPIVCFEYLGNFYVQEGNKRVSVLRHFGAARIPSYVTRIVPPLSEDPRVKAYYEFMDFYKVSRLYAVQFRRPGDYAKLLLSLGKKPDEIWTEDDRRTFNAYYLYFLDAFNAVNTKQADILPEEALLFWLELNPFQELGRMSNAQLKKSITVLWDDIISTRKAQPVKMKTTTEDTAKQNIISRFVASLDVVHVAFIHQLDASRST